MKVLNIHTREIAQPIDRVAELVKSISTKNDLIWPYEKWPAMRFIDGLIEGAHGGHGFIGYFVKEYKSASLLEFQFTKPVGLIGIHRFEISSIDKERTLIKHTIDAKASGLTILLWPIMIRPLHDALVEDAFDKVQSHFNISFHKSNWSLLVRFWRSLLT